MLWIVNNNESSQRQKKVMIAVKDVEVLVMTTLMKTVANHCWRDGHVDCDSDRDDSCDSDGDEDWETDGDESCWRWCGRHVGGDQGRCNVCLAPTTCEGNEGKQFFDFSFLLFSQTFKRGWNG